MLAIRIKWISRIFWKIVTVLRFPPRTKAKISREAGRNFAEETTRISPYVSLPLKQLTLLSVKGTRSLSVSSLRIVCELGPRRGRERESFREREREREVGPR